jgi:ABC-type transport system substrate-binding protein
MIGRRPVFTDVSSGDPLKRVASAPVAIRGEAPREEVREGMMSKGKIGALAGMVLAAVSLAFAADRGGHLNYSHRQNLSAFDPITANDVATTQFASMMFEYILERKKVGVGVKCRMCKDYKTGDQLITFYLRPDIKWHDGVPMDAYDVDFSYRLVINPKTGSPLRKELDEIEDITVLDDYSISATFGHPVPAPEAYFLALPIIPRHKFSVFRPSIQEDSNLGTVREARVKTEAYESPDVKSRVSFEVDPGAKLSVIKFDKRWAEVKVIAKGPVGKSGWVIQHRAELNEKDDAEFLTNPVGTGPYMFAGAPVNGDANLKANENYYDKKAYIESIRRKRSQDVQTMVNRLTEEVIDLIPETPLESISKIQTSGVCKMINYASLRFAGLRYNCKNPYLAKKAFRQALTYASNRPGWLETFYQGKGFLIAGPAAPDSWLFNTTLSPLPFDLAKAKKLRAEAVGNAPITLKLILDNERPSQDQSMVNAYQDGMKALNITVNIVTLEKLVFDEALRKGDFDVALQDYLLSYGYNYRPLFESDGDLNYGHYENKDLDVVLRGWRSESDFEKIRQLANKSQDIIADDCPWTFLWTLKNIASVNNKVRNIRAENIDPLRFFTWVHEWWIPTESQ